MTYVPELNDSSASGVDLALDKSRLRLVEYAHSIETDPASMDVGYSARVWAQVSLPYRDPGDAQYWERRNGNVTLTMRPALLSRADGTRYQGYPFGLLPRQAMTWMATEAVRTQSPELELGRSMNSFMQKLDMAHNGRNAVRLTEQLRRVFGSQLSVEGLAVNEHGHGSMTQYFQVADSVQLWFSNNDVLDNEGLWQSRVVLSDQFFQSIINAPVPIDIRAIRALGSSPFRIDVYIWASYRMFYLRQVTRIKWADLNRQFGAQYAETRLFKRAFLRALADVKVIYPDLNVEAEKDYLVLKPSRTHVAGKPPRRLAQ